jgi:hypothetical protein
MAVIERQPDVPTDTVLAASSHSRSRRGEGLASPGAGSLRLWQAFVDMVEEQSRRRTT